LIPIAILQCLRKVNLLVAKNKKFRYYTNTCE